MKTRVLFGSALGAAVVIAAGCGVAAFASEPMPAPTIRVEKTVSVKDTFDIRLDANATTGFSWVVHEAASTGLAKLTAAGESFEMPNRDPQVVGASGVQVFKFTAAAPGQVKLVFVYRRPWVPDVYEKTAEARITIG